MKKLLTILLATICLFALCACNSGSNLGSNQGSNSTGSNLKVGVVQTTQHPALDAATQGFVDALKENGITDVDVQNASGESANCSTIVGNFVADGVDLIMANATPALQAASAATDTIPVLGTSITVYDVVLGGSVPKNVSGTTDLAPLDEQASMIKELFPDAKKVGILFCSAEANSQYQVDKISEFLKEDGKYYVVIRAVHGKQQYDKECFYRFGEELILAKHPVLLEYLDQEYVKYSKIKESLTDDSKEHIRRRKEEVEDLLGDIMEALCYYEL